MRSGVAARESLKDLIGQVSRSLSAHCRGESEKVRVAISVHGSVVFLIPLVVAAMAERRVVKRGSPRRSYAWGIV